MQDYLPGIVDMSLGCMGKLQIETATLKLK
jgi:hypothetical protein